MQGFLDMCGPAVETVGTYLMFEVWWKSKEPKSTEIYHNFEWCYHSVWKDHHPRRRHHHHHPFSFMTDHGY